LFSGRGGVAVADFGVAGCDVNRPSGRRIDEGKNPNVGKFELARVQYLDSEDLVTKGQSSEAFLPGIVTEKV
jgi:hypothetical protein